MAEKKPEPEDVPSPEEVNEFWDKGEEGHGTEHDNDWYLDNVPPPETGPDQEDPLPRNHPSLKHRPPAKPE